VEVRTVAPPVVRLGRDTVLCAGAPPFTLRATSQPAGSTYRWADGTAAATLVVRQPGLYWLEVRGPAGCVTRDTLLVRPGSPATGCPEVVVPTVRIPNVITPNGDAHNEFFVLEGLVPAEWALTVYDRWGRLVVRQARYDNRWNAAGQAAGLYYYWLQHTSTGQQLRGWVEVVR
jgi:gliding motility-associated-like protein